MFHTEAESLTKLIWQEPGTEPEGFTILMPLHDSGRITPMQRKTGGIASGSSSPITSSCSGACWWPGTRGIQRYGNWAPVDEGA